MPSFSTVQLQNLVEPRARRSYAKSLKVDQFASAVQEVQAATDETTLPVATKHIYISPALYRTPEPAPIPEELSVPLSPSPYVVNHKRRGGCSRAVGGRQTCDGAVNVPVAEMEERVEGGSSETMNDDLEGGHLRGQGLDGVVVEGECNEEEEEGFLVSKCVSIGVGSANDSIRQFDCKSFMSTHGEFYDAVEDFSNDSCVPTTSSYTQSVESEIRSKRLNLFEEINRRKKAEEALDLMQRRWQKMGSLLHEAKLTYLSCSIVKGTMHCEDVPMEEVFQEVVVFKYIDEAIAKGLGHAKAELDAEVIMGSKDEEISRLRDKLAYYEAANREMSLRNQEITENGRKQRQRKNLQKKWIWSCIGLSIVAGVSIVAYSYLPEHQEFTNHMPLHSSTSTDTA